MHNLIKKLIQQKNFNEKTLSEIKRNFCRKKNGLINNFKILEIYHQMVENREIKPSPNLEKLLKLRPVRTLSGVAVVTVITKIYPCPGKCLYCPQEKSMPKSYLSNEPAIMRAILCQFDPYRQIQGRLKSLEQIGHPTDKIEMIILGATWSAYPKSYQTWFIKKCFEAVNDFKKATCLPARQGKQESQPKADQPWAGKKTKKQIKGTILKNLQKINETAKHRIIGLSVETRPDLINEKEIKRLRELGCTRIELGVQNVYDDILQFNRRGHKVEDVIRATRLLKNAGFKICYHLMPDLPGSTPARDFKMFQKIFSNTPASAHSPRYRESEASRQGEAGDFQPDMLKIYPCVVVKGAPLYQFWKKGKHKPYSPKQLITLLIKIKKIIPVYVRVNRLVRDIPSISIEAGNKITNLREIIQRKMRQQGDKCRCIRCREIKGEKIVLKNIKFKTIKYPASGGIEYFLSYEDVKNDKIIAFLRLRFPQHLTPNTYILKLKGCALVRELHTYGQLISISQKNKNAQQHRGWGKKLMLQAEKISRQNGYSKIAVIAGVGVREYYRKLGYKLEGTYMVKNLI